MAIEQAQLQCSWASVSGGLASQQYYAVTIGSSGVDVATAGKNCTGILQNAPGAYQAAEICTFGITKAKITASSNVSVGTLLDVDSGGTLKATAGGVVVARALEACNSAVINTITVELLKSNNVFA